MKKLLTTLCLIAGLSAAAQTKQFKTADTTAKTPAPITSYTITLTPQQLQQLWYALDRSNAEHDAIVRPVEELINQQVTEQNQKNQPKK
jgi:hypothetical protein